MTTKIYKHHYGYGWVAESSIDIEGGRAIRFFTMKRSSGNLVTTVTVGTADENSFSFVMFQDFNKIIIQTRPSRVTAKVVEQQHNQIDVDAVKAQVKEFYK